MLALTGNPPVGARAAAAVDLRPRCCAFLVVLLPFHLMQMGRRGITMAVGGRTSWLGRRELALTDGARAARRRPNTAGRDRIPEAFNNRHVCGG